MALSTMVLTHLTLLGKGREGYGVQRWPDGSMYEGHWKNDRANGQGRFVFSNGDTYEGEWKDDMANGVGVYTKAEGVRYEGIWVNDLQNGPGKEIWTDGSKYEGNYVDGKREGRGIYLWPNGVVYEGEWKDNKISGFVILQTTHRERTSGTTGGCTQATGRTGACTGTGSTPTPTGECTRESLCGTREKDMAHTIGRTADSTQANGTMDSSME
eukprot:TRINITY_DN2263_c0_g1_i10.p1 TRINITY_DN2263_c0_g1~~TRINITY_DN2263_c0_g1_i10.p1  ORF type:complete len:213 (+),score=17.88 TRINITY_DN2263_c0_g1_i10:224-862(+)